METVDTTYTGKIAGSGSVKVEAPELDLELHQMILWIMLHEGAAMALIPEYNRLRAELEAK